MTNPPLPTTTLQNAKHLRRTMTDAEQRLWYHLRAGRLNGLKFRRQHPLPPYIADFACPAHKLIVEVDGSQHSVDGDAVRSNYLKGQGWRVIHFWAHDVMQQTEAVLEAILQAVVGVEAGDGPDPDPLPQPLSRRERGAKEP
ncbi:MAG: endonuclease domain-containing protein [Pseudomonadota bacterium]|nr:endonuclease domain-containing protein [Pseudomonadota bacterium]